MLVETLQEEERVQQRKEKDQTHHTNNNNKVPFQTTNNKKNKTCETCDPPKNLELSYIFNNTPQGKQVPCGHRGSERERVHLPPCIVVTAPVFHFDTS